MNRDFEDLTDEQLAGRAYLSLVSADDELPDNAKYDDGVRMLGVLWYRLRGPYCKEEGCEQLRLKSFPWCAWHRPESYGPLPDDFPPYPQSEPSR